MRSLAVVLVAVCGLLAGAGGGAAEPETPVREIFVPFDDLDVLLEGSVQRAFVSREEYRDLLTKTKQPEPRVPAPQTVVLLAAEYDVTMAGERAVIRGAVEVEVLEPGLHAVPLALDGVGVLAADLDQAAAVLGRAADGQTQLFLEGVGRHTLTLDLLTRVEASAAQQSLAFTVPTPPTTRLRIVVPGNVEMRSAVLLREFDAAAGITRFEVPVAGGPQRWAMSLNNRLKSQQQVVEARSVIVDEVTQAYERLHATVTMRMLRGAVDTFRFRLPVAFAVTDVVAPQVARWAVKEPAEGDATKVLEVSLHEPATEPVALSITALAAGPSLGEWSMPEVVALDTVSHVAVRGLLLDERLAGQSFVTSGLVPIDHAVLRKAMPATVFMAEPGSPRIRPVAAWFSPQDGGRAVAQLTRPEAGIEATTAMLLTLHEQRQHLRGTISLQPKVDPVFAVDLLVPSGWDVTGVFAEDGTPLPFEPTVRAIANTAAGSGVHVRLPQRVLPGSTVKLSLEAESVPEGWLGDWSEHSVAFPVVALDKATIASGAIAVTAVDDLEVRPERLQGLIPLARRELEALGLTADEGTFAYRLGPQTPDAAFQAIRRVPHLTARSFNFLRIENDALFAHYELLYDIQRAGTRVLSFSLPLSTPPTITLRGLGDVQVSEFSSREEDDRRIWTARLAGRTRGVAAIAVDIEQPLVVTDELERPLPCITAEGVAYQSAAVAVEGNAEVSVSLATDGRPIDVGELVDAEYQVGRRLLGVFGFADVAEITATIVRRPGYGLPAAIIQRGEIVTLQGLGGVSQTAARFALRTNASFLHVTLPPSATLWSVTIDGAPSLPQRDGDDLLVSVPPGGDTTTIRDVSIVYETPSAMGGVLKRVSHEPPHLAVRNEGGERYAVPMADVEWRLVVPAGQRIVGSGGTVFAPEGGEPWRLKQVASWLVTLGGGVRPFRWSDLGAWVVPQATAPVELVADSRSFEPTDMDAPAEPAAGAAPAAPPLPALVDELQQAGEAREEKDAAGVEFAEKAKNELGDAKNFGSAAPARPTGETRGEAGGEQVWFRQSWALEGVRSLPIDLDQTGASMTYQSLGGAPRLTATLVDEGRVRFAAVGLAVLAGGLGLALTRSRWRIRAAAVVLILLGAVAGPAVADLVYGLDANAVCEPAFLVGLILLPFYAAVDLIGWLAGRCPLCRWRVASAGGLLLAVMATLATANVGCGGAVAAEDQPEAATDLADLLDRLVPGTPLQLPDNAVIIPYDGTREDGVATADKVLVPYADYARLKRLAAGADAEERATPPAAYGFAGATYEATLDETGDLIVSGAIEIEVYAEGAVEIPFELQGAVLERATLAGRPALLRVIEPVDGQVPQAEPAQQAVQQQAMQQQAMQQQAMPAPSSLVVLTLDAPGRHTLDVAVRFHLEQRGGWRVANGRLPTAPAAKLALTVPLAETEVRLVSPHDRPAYETTVAAERIEAALPVDGRVGLEWRSKVSQALIDEALTASSVSLFDVREDGVQLAWLVDLDVRQGQRERFTLAVPAGYLIDEVQGQNVRGWEVSDRDGGQEIEVTLLEPARGRERLFVRLSRPQAIVFADAATVDVAAMTVPDAAVHQGYVAVRRGALVDLQVEAVEGLSRDEVPAERLAELVARLANESPLPLRAFQAYRFSSDRFALSLAARATTSKLAVEVQTLLRLADQESTFETRLLCEILDRPLHTLTVELPGGVEVETVACEGLSSWAVTNDGEGRRLAVLLEQGALGPFAVTLTGTVAGADEVAAPAFRVASAARHSGTVVVQADPVMSVDVRGLQNAETIPLARTFVWLAEGQRSLARLAIEHRSAEFAASFQAVRRQPIVTGLSVTNVRVTPREIEETILLRFRIEEAGIREVSFRGPASLRTAVVQVPLLQEMTVEDLPAEPESVRVRLTLQDDVIGTLAVLVQQSRSLPQGDYEPPLAVIETGSTANRYVVLESAGRDEVVVTTAEGVRELNRQQAEWRELASILPGNTTQAYVVDAAAAAPRLALAMRSRALVETAGARIGLAVTTLTVDGSGEYRATQEYRVDNKTEQLLEVELPQGATLWSAVVAGEAVKPTPIDAAGGGSRVGVPLIKTQAGDLDYGVVLTYGGSLGGFEPTQPVRFPLVRTVNINIEQSHVRLWLPQTHRWFGFDGTLRRTTDADELAADFFSYQNKKLQQLMQVASSESNDLLCRVRASTNARQLGESLQGYRDSYRGRSQAGAANERLQRELTTNGAIVEQAQSQQPQVVAAADADADGNTEQLQRFYFSQDVARGTNVVSGLTNNFDPGPAVNAPATPPPAEDSFNGGWLKANRFGRQAGQGQASGFGLGASSGPVAEGRLTKSSDEAPSSSTAETLNADFQELSRKRLAEQPESALEEAEPQAARRSLGLRDQVQRYQDRLEVEGMRQQLADKEATTLGDDLAGEVPGQSWQFEGQGGMGGIGGGAGFGGGMARGGSGYAGMPAGPGDGVTVFSGRDPSRLAAGQGVDFDGAAGKPVAAGLASLTVDVPTRGTEFLFTTPRGDIEITAHAVEERFVSHAVRAGLVIGGLFGLWIAVRLAIALWRQLGFWFQVGVLLVGGLISLATLVLPILGAAATLVGLTLVVSRLRQPRMASA